MKKKRTPIRISWSRFLQIAISRPGCRPYPDKKKGKKKKKEKKLADRGVRLQRPVAGTIRRYVRNTTKGKGRRRK